VTHKTPHDLDDASDDTTAPGEIEGAPAAPLSMRALALLDDEVTHAADRDRTVVRREPGAPPPRSVAVGAPPVQSPVAPPSPERDLFADVHDVAEADEPMTLPVGARSPVLHDLFSADGLTTPYEERAPLPPRVHTIPPAREPTQPPLVPHAIADADFDFAVEPDDEPDDRSRVTASPFPCSLRVFLDLRKSTPGLRAFEETAIQLARCVHELHAQGTFVGERLVPENFVCEADGRVRFVEAPEAPPRERVEVYLAPEFFRGRRPSVQSDVFAAAAISYELLTGRTAKPVFLPKVMQALRTDTWFADPGSSMREPYKRVLRQGLADRASERHPDVRVFAMELYRAWRLVHNPERRLAEPEKPDESWKRLLVPAAVVVVFVIIVLALLLFPVDRIDAPPVPNVRPELNM
jgi:hypothetical protein